MWTIVKLEVKIKVKTSVDEYQQILKDLEARLQSIENERNELQSAISAIRKIVSRLASGDAPSGMPNIGPNRFRNMTLAKAAADLIGLVGGPMKTSEIRDGLLLGGFQSNAKNFYNAVHSTLSTAKGFEKQDGKWSYSG